jgi:glycine cleavage system transcriptional repressor
VDTVSVLVSASGADRPGIVAAVTRVLYELGGNLEDSAMTRLEGAFAMLVIVRVAATRLDELRTAFARLAEESGLHIHVKTMSAGETRQPSAEGEPYIISLYGGDRPGLVYRVASLLADLGVNISDVVTHRSAAEGRGPLYQLVLEVEVADEAAGRTMRQRLEALQRELEVEISVRPMELVEL